VDRRPGYAGRYEPERGGKRGDAGDTDAHIEQHSGGWLANQAILRGAAAMPDTLDGGCQR
jgi:hypothetical protein